MYRTKRLILIFILATAFLGACNRIPDYAGYIPKDAVAVAGINLSSLSKKIAWNMITGSKLFKEMQKRIPEKNAKDAMSGIEKAGINTSSTFYVYIKSDNRFKGGNRVTGLVPLSDADQWETYIKQVFPQAAIKPNGNHKEAALGTDMYVGWDKHLLIIMNVIGGDYDDDESTAPAPATDVATLSAEMNNAFNVPKDNSLLGNKQFAGLETEGHDVTFWLNYEQLMNQYSGNVAEKMGGVSLSGNLWKDAALTAGFDFKKGKISGDMHYFIGDGLRDIGNEFAAASLDKEMLDRMPNKNMDMLITMHVSPKAIKAILEKTQLLGLANVGLAAQNLTVDEVLDAFTGDMAIVMNDFSMQTEKVTESFMGQNVVMDRQRTVVSMSYAMKINKKENFKKLMQLAAQNGLMPANGGYVIPIDPKDSVYILNNDQYAVISNKYNYATGILAGDFKTGKLKGEAYTLATTNPCAMYLDIQQFVGNVNSNLTENPRDSAMVAESKKLLSSIAMGGGGFKNNAFDYHLDINFTNQDENSIIQILDYVMKMNDASNQQVAN